MSQILPCFCDGGLVPNVMHDILEGALQHEVKLMLKKMLEIDKYFSLGTHFFFKLEDAAWYASIFYTLYILSFAEHRAWVHGGQ